MSNWKTLALIAISLGLTSCGTWTSKEGERAPSTEQNRTYEQRQRVQLEREIKAILGKTAMINQYTMKQDEIF